MLSGQQQQRARQLLELIQQFQQLLEDEAWKEVEQAGRDSMGAQQKRMMHPSLSTEEAHYWRGYVAGINDTLAIPTHSINSYKRDLKSLGVDKYVGGTVQE